MNKWYLHIVVVYTATFVKASVRKYDIEEESKKFFNQDFKGVLLSFRQSPQYIAILNEKRNELSNIADTAVNDGLNSIEEDIWQIVEREFGDLAATGNGGTTEKTLVRSLKYNRFRIAMAADQALRRDYDSTNPKILSPVEALDDIRSNWLTKATERNRVRDHMFNYLKDYFLRVIDDLAPEMVTGASTMGNIDVVIDETATAGLKLGYRHNTL